MIDEKKLLADLNNFLFTTEMNSVAYKTIEQCIECVDNQPQVDMWIPCKPDKPLEDEAWVSKEFIEECKEVTKKYKKTNDRGDEIND